ncbi:MAG: beta-lactamase family protein [Anaerolineae bacterium]|nr:beta-lactamase family protein [Anaerolineae bacterium]MCI0607689.1 beta-lactamase family protein [Anaerolineae bacterium]
MFRYSYTGVVRLSLIVLSLILASCKGLSVSVTQSPTVTESSPPSPTLEPEDPASKIDKTLNFLTERESFTGAVLVARNGEVLLSQGYGLADRDKNFPNTPQTKYRLGSITKQFTAMAILMLQAQNKLKVQDPVCHYIPECPVMWQDITIHHLLTHTSGIPDFTDFPDYETTKATPSSPLQTIARFKDMPLDFKPGEQWTYSNSGYILLGYIIEQASGQSYETFLQQNIFEPVQMKNTGYDHNDGSLATGYTGFYGHWEKADYLDMTIPYAAGGLYSTIEDLYRWDQVLYTEQLMSQELLHLMFTPHVRIPDTGLSYGYGWIAGEMNNHQVISHGGVIESLAAGIGSYTNNSGNGFQGNNDIEGLATEIRRYTDDRVTIIILSNRDTTNVGTVSDQIAQTVLGEQ